MGACRARLQSEAAGWPAECGVGAGLHLGRATHVPPLPQTTYPPPPPAHTLHATLLPPPRFDANAELAPEGFCQISCDRCSCCQAPWTVLQQLGATRFLQVPLHPPALLLGAARFVLTCGECLLHGARLSPLCH